MPTTNKSPVRVEVESLEQAKRLAESGKLFAVVDACDEPLVPPMMIHLGKHAMSLYRGQAQQDYWAIAPYLCEVDVETLDWIVANLWKQPWGFLFESTSELQELHAHFRHFIMIKQNGKMVYFRFYDPRVLQPFLLACNAEETRKFFGPVDRFGTNPIPDEIHWMTSDQN